MDRFPRTATDPPALHLRLPRPAPSAAVESMARRKLPQCLLGRVLWMLILDTRLFSSEFSQMQAAWRTLCGPASAVATAADGYCSSALANDQVKRSLSST